MFYPGFSLSGNKDISLGKPKVDDQMLKGNPRTAYAVEQEHKLVFVNGKLVAFGNKAEINSISLFSLEPITNE